MSAGLADLWPVNDLIRKIAGASNWHRALIAELPLLADQSARTTAITKWLRDPNPNIWLGANARALAELSVNPPLPFFVMFEAMQDPTSKGCRLGPLGSVLVAEAIFGELERNKLWSETMDGDLPVRLANISGSFSGIADMATMSDVATFIWSHPRLSPDLLMNAPSLV